MTHIQAAIVALVLGLASFHVPADPNAAARAVAATPSKSGVVCSPVDEAPGESGHDSEAELNAIRGRVQSVRDIFCNKFNLTMPSFVVIPARTDVGDDQHGFNQASAWPGIKTLSSPDGWSYTTSGKSDLCVIQTYPRTHQAFRAIIDGKLPESDPDQALWLARFDALLAHELYHCHQFYRSSDIGLFNRIGDWLIEGSAEWARQKYLQHVYPGTDLSRLSPQRLSDLWDSYLESPQTTLFHRDYDALGFFGYLEYETKLESAGVDVWSIIDLMQEVHEGARSVAQGDRDAFDAAHFMAGPRSLQHWAMSFVRDPLLGPHWDTGGPGITGYRPTLEPFEIGNGQSRRWAVESAAVQRVRIRFGSDVRLLKVQTQGYGGLYWKNSSTGRGAEEVLPGAVTRYYCVRPGSCSSPGSAAASRSLDACRLLTPEDVLLTEKSIVSVERASSDGSSPHDEVLLRPADELILAFTGGAEQGFAEISAEPVSVTTSTCRYLVKNTTRYNPYASWDAWVGLSVGSFPTYDDYQRRLDEVRLANRDAQIISTDESNLPDIAYYHCSPDTAYLNVITRDYELYLQYTQELIDEEISCGKYRRASVEVMRRMIRRI